MRGHTGSMSYWMNILGCYSKQERWSTTFGEEFGVLGRDSVGCHPFQPWEKVMERNF